MANVSLSVSNLGGQVHAVSCRRGVPAARWEGQQTGEEVEIVAALFRDMVAKTRPEGKQVWMVFAHPRLSDQIQEVPPAKGQALERLLERQAQKAKAFPDEATWSWQPALPTKKADAVLLHLCPKSVVDQLSRGCARADLQLARLLPSTAVLIGHLKSLPLEKDELALLAADTGRSTTIVIGRKDGRVALARVLATSWAIAAERVWIDLTRSIGFSEQQSGLPVNSVWLFGPGAEAQVSSAQVMLKVPVRVSPIPYTPYYWAEQAIQLPDKNDGNLITLAERQAPQRRRMLTLTVIILMVLVLLSLLAAATAETARKFELKSIQEINRLMAKMQQNKEDWQKRYAEAARKKELTRLVTEDKGGSVPIWFLGYLGEIVPDELILTDLRVLRQTNEWSVRMAGVVQSTNALLSVPAESVLALKTNLITGPFQMEVTGGSPGVVEKVPEPGTVVKKLVSQVTLAPVAPLPQGQLNQFAIEGWIRQKDGGAVKR